MSSVVVLQLKLRFSQRLVCGHFWPKHKYLRRNLFPNIRRLQVAWNKLQKKKTYSWTNTSSMVLRLKKLFDAVVCRGVLATFALAQMHIITKTRCRSRTHVLFQCPMGATSWWLQQAGHPGVPGAYNHILATTTILSASPFGCSKWLAHKTSRIQFHPHKFVPPYGSNWFVLEHGNNRDSQS